MKPILPRFNLASILLLAVVGAISAHAQSADSAITSNATPTPATVPTSIVPTSSPAFTHPKATRPRTNTPPIPPAMVLPPKPAPREPDQWTAVADSAALPASAIKHPAAVAAKVPAPLGLPRLKPESDNSKAPQLASSKFDLVTWESSTNPPGQRKTRQGPIDYLAVDGHQEWSQPLRGAQKDVLFVSFVLNASRSTVIDVGGAWLSVADSEVKGQAEIMIGEPGKKELTWRKLNYRVPLNLYDGQSMATLPTLTVRLDPAAGTWDIYSGTRQVADNLSLVTGGARQLTIRAGESGAWICGVVTSDENPLFADANSNGIDDAYEVQKRGALAASDASAADRKTLAKDWRTAENAKPPQVLQVIRPKPDRVAASAPTAPVLRRPSH